MNIIQKIEERDKLDKELKNYFDLATTFELINLTSLYWRIKEGFLEYSQTEDFDRSITVDIRFKDRPDSIINKEEFTVVPVREFEIPLWFVFFKNNQR